MIDAEAPASPVCFTVADRGSEVILVGEVDFREAWVEVPFPGAVDFDGVAAVLLAGTAESFAGCRALPFTANELS